MEHVFVDRIEVTVVFNNFDGNNAKEIIEEAGKEISPDTILEDAYPSHSLLFFILTYETTKDLTTLVESDRVAIKRVINRRNRKAK